MTDVWESAPLAVEVWESQSTPGVVFETIVRDGAGGGGGSGRVDEVEGGANITVTGTATKPKIDVTGILPDARIPNLAASKVTSGQFNIARLASGTAADGFVPKVNSAGTGFELTKGGWHQIGDTLTIDSIAYPSGVAQIEYPDLDDFIRLELVTFGAMTNRNSTADLISWILNNDLTARYRRSINTVAIPTSGGQIIQALGLNAPATESIRNTVTIGNSSGRYKAADAVRIKASDASATNQQYWWEETAAITNMKLVPSSGTAIVAGTFTLMGVKR